MGADAARLQLVAYFDCTVLCVALPLTFGSTGLFGTALGLLE